MRKIEVNLFLLIFLITVSKGFCGAWVIETVYDSEDIYGTSIALDSNDNPCIAFHILDSNDLMYAYFDGSVWQIDDVDISGGVGWHPSMELDDNDYPHISYYDSTNGDLKYAKWTGSSWEITRFDIGGYNGNRSSIALDSMGHPHISYHDETTKTLRYIWWNGTTWDRTTVDVLYGTGEPNSIAINSLDYPSISYRYRDYTNYTFTLKCARWNGTTWEITSIDTSDYAVAWYNSIDIDANDYEHIAYQTIYCLKYAKRTSSGWETQIVNNDSSSGEDCSITLDSNMNPHISYYFYDSGSRYDLVYVYKDGDSWVEDIVDGGYYDTGKYNSIFLDSADLPHISYMGGPPDDLKYAYYDPNDIDDAPPTTPTGFALTHPIPNPSIGTATVSFALPRPCDINLSLYDIKGRKIATLAEGQYQPGEYPSEVSGLSSGIYLYRFVAGEFSDTKKMIVK